MIMRSLSSAGIADFRFATLDAGSNTDDQFLSTNCGEGNLQGAKSES
jgi:hypothetical protein